MLHSPSIPSFLISSLIIINIKNWTLWSVPSPKLQLLSPTFLWSSNCSPSLRSVVVWFQTDSILWHSLQVLKPVPSVLIYLSTKGAHLYRRRDCLEVLRLATTKLTQRGTGYPSWRHPTQLRISRGSTGLTTNNERQNTCSKKFFVVYFSPHSYHFLCLMCEYPPQHPVPTHPQ